MDEDFLKWIEENAKLVSNAYPLWIRAALWLDSQDPVMATLCRRIAGDMQRFIQQSQEHLLTHKLEPNDLTQVEDEQVVNEALKKAGL